MASDDDDKVIRGGIVDVIGIDPSLTASGIASIDGVPSTVRGRANDDRLDHLYVSVVAAASMADFAVVEDLPTHAQGAGKTGMAQGVVRLALLAQHVPYVLVPPATLKKFATGRGNATKPDMRMAWFQTYGRDLRDDNQVDALWLRSLGRHWWGLEDVLTIQCLGKLKWGDIYDPAI